jgi:hypothetical protein
LPRIPELAFLDPVGLRERVDLESFAERAADKLELGDSGLGLRLVVLEPR